MSDADQATTYTEQGRRVTDHWSRLAVTYEGALEALEKQGIAADAAKPENLHGLNMIHMGGVTATDALAEMANVQAGHRVLDVGSGVGGPARRIVSKYGAELWGVELSETLCPVSSIPQDVPPPHGKAFNQH